MSISIQNYLIDGVTAVSEYVLWKVDVDIVCVKLLIFDWLFLITEERPEVH